MNFCFYDNAGYITQILVSPTKETARLQEGSFLECEEGCSDDAHFVDLSGPGPRIREKSSLDTEHDISGFVVTLTALPDGTRLEVEGLEIESDADGAEVEFEAPGTYEIRLSPPPQYRDDVLEVTVG